MGHLEQGGKQSIQSLNAFSRGIAHSWDYWIDRTWIDWAIAIALAITTARYRIWEIVEVTDHGAFYQTMTSVALAFLGLGTVAVTLLVTVTPSRDLRKALSESGQDLIRNMFRCLHGLILAAILYAVLFGVDGTNLGLARSSLFAIATTIMLLRAVRLLWLLQRILSLLL